MGLIGPNGAGKSSLLKVFAGVHKPTSGSLHLHGVEFSNLPPSVRARHIAYLAQANQIHWPISVEQLVSLGRFAQQGVAAHNNSELVERAIARAGIEHLRDRSVTTLSGGERMRALVARTIATDADYLLVDEPLTNLDPAYQLEVMRLLQAEVAEGKAALVVLHDLGLVSRFCSRIVVLRDGRIVTQGTARDVITESLLQQVFAIAPGDVDYWLSRIWGENSGSARGSLPNNKGPLTN